MILKVAREAADQRGIACSLMLPSAAALANGAFAEARGYLHEAVEIGREFCAYPWAGTQAAGEMLATLAYAERGNGDTAKTREHLREALEKATEIREFCALITALPAAALLLADEGQAERAVEIYALASRYAYVANSQWFEDVAGKQIAAVASTLPPDVVAAAQERGHALDLWATAQELLD
jgi:hypothetical protein